MYKLGILLIKILFGKESVLMLAMLWAQAIINERPGYTYARVPNRLKESVKQILIDSGCEDLVTE